MGEKVIQVINGQRLEHEADHVYVTDVGLILLNKKEDLKLWKMIYAAQVYDKDHIISIITTPQSSTGLAIKEEL